MSDDPTLCCADCAVCPCGFTHACSGDCHPGTGCEPIPLDDDGQIHDLAEADQQLAALEHFADAKRDVCGAVAALLANPVDLDGFKAVMRNGDRMTMSCVALNLLAGIARETQTDAAQFRAWAMRAGTHG